MLLETKLVIYFHLKNFVGSWPMNNVYFIPKAMLEITEMPTPSYSQPDWKLMTFY